jgi:hypothetical protein
MDNRCGRDRGNGVPCLKLSSKLCKNKREMRKETRIFITPAIVISFEECDSPELDFARTGVKTLALQALPLGGASEINAEQRMGTGAGRRGCK